MSALAVDADDDAETLNFGPEFPMETCECLSDAEVTTILDNTMKTTAGERPSLRKTYEYARRSIGNRPVEAVKSETIHIRPLAAPRPTVSLARPTVSSPPPRDL